MIEKLKAEELATHTYRGSPDEFFEADLCLMHKINELVDAVNNICNFQIKIENTRKYSIGDPNETVKTASTAYKEPATLPKTKDLTLTEALVFLKQGLMVRRKDSPLKMYMDDDLIRWKNNSIVFMEVDLLEATDWEVCK